MGHRDYFSTIQIMKDPTNDVRREDPPDSQNDKWYFHEEDCKNCAHRNTAYVRKGVRLIGLTIACDNCGCAISLRP